jgi:hypothetical protein
MRKPYAQNNLRQTRRRPENRDMRNFNDTKGMSLCRYFRGVLLCARRSSASIGSHGPGVDGQRTMTHWDGVRVRTRDGPEGRPLTQAASVYPAISLVSRALLQ